MTDNLSSYIENWIWQFGYDNMEIFAVCNTKWIFEHFSMTEGQVGGRILWDHSFIEAKQRDACSNWKFRDSIFAGAFLHVLHPPGLSAADKAKKENTTGPTALNAKCASLAVKVWLARLTHVGVLRSTSGQVNPASAGHIRDGCDDIVGRIRCSPCPI